MTEDRIPVRRTRMFPPPCRYTPCQAHYPPKGRLAGCICTLMADETGWHLMEHKRICTAHDVERRAGK